jgi:hypothetical protein
MLRYYRIVLTIIYLTIYLFSHHLMGEGKDNNEIHHIYKHSIDLTPLSPLMGIYAIHYNYRITPNSEIIVSPLYMNIKYEDIGHTNAPGFIIGYRYYVWGNIHIDYQLMPGWDRFYEKNEDKYYKGFDLWNEFRLGYTWDFRIGNIPSFINFQWPFGFALYSENKPESFKEHIEDNKYFYFPPMFFIGIRF